MASLKVRALSVVDKLFHNSHSQCLSNSSENKDNFSAQPSDCITV